MRIGIDIDGVLTDVEKYQIDLGSKYFYLKHQKQVIDYKAYDTTDMFKVSQKEDNLFWQEIIYDYAKNEHPRKFASEIIKKLKDDGNQIYIITARTSDLSYTDIKREEMKNIVLEWLKMNSIYYDKIIFTPEDKLEICLDNNIDLMIEDKSKNINEISTKIPVICFHANYNEECIGHNIIRCYSWYDIYAKINERFN